MEMRSFSGYMREAIRALQSEERFAIAYIYNYALRAFHQFVGGGEIFFGALKRSTLKRFEHYLRDRQCSWNTVSTYIRSLRTIYNQAVDEGIIAGEYRLFSGVFTGVKSDKKRALTHEEIRQLLQSSTIPPMPTHSHRKRSKQLPRATKQAQDMLALMFMMQGMPFTDLIHLKKDDLQTDLSGKTCLSCRRQKTGTELNVEVLPEAMAIIERYRNRDKSSSYLLYFADDDVDGESTFQNYRRQLRFLNYHLSKLPKLLGMNVKVSSYTARHTWATLAKYCGVPEEVISEALGHSSLDVTRTYLKRFKNDTLSHANQIIYHYAFKGEKQAWTMA